MSVALIYREELKNYDFGKGHPFKGDRFKIFLDFFEKRFYSFKGNFEKIKPQFVSDEILRLVHSKEYIEAIKCASQGIVLSNIFKYVSGDNLNPLTGNIPKNIEKAARTIVGVSLLAGELIAENRFKKAIGIGGGLHHAKPNYGEGFCFYNDVAICIENLKRNYSIERILLLDTDAHAGNGTEEIFYEDPKVLFIDLHQDPKTIYPGTGFISRIGSGKGEGFTVNFPLVPGTSNQAYQYIFDKIIFPLAEEFKPQVIIRYGGSDPHYLDELTNLGLTIQGFRMIGQKVRELAEEFCEGKAIDLITSGYNLKILPFAWAALISGLLDLDVFLGDLKESSHPPKDYKLKETKDIARELKKHLKKYWRCMEKDS